MHLPSATLQQHSMRSPVPPTSRASATSTKSATADIEPAGDPKVDKVPARGDQ